MAGCWALLDRTLTQRPCPLLQNESLEQTRQSPTTIAVFIQTALLNTVYSYRRHSSTQCIPTDDTPQYSVFLQTTLLNTVYSYRRHSSTQCIPTDGTHRYCVFLQTALLNTVYSYRPHSSIQCIPTDGTLQYS